MLLGITLLSWLLMDVTVLATRVVGALLLVMAFVNVQVILNQYMEPGKATLPVRWAFHIWLLLAAGITIALHL